MDSTYLKEYIAILDQLSEAGPNVSYQSPSMGGASSTQYDDGSSASNYDAGPLAVQQKKDPTGNMQSNRVRYNTGTDSVQVKDYASGVKKLTVHGPGEDAYVGPNASAQRLGVDPAKVNNFVNPSANTPPEPETMEEGDYELEEMRRLAYGTSDDIEEAGVGEGQTSEIRKFFSAEPGTASIPQVAARYRAYEEDMSEDADSTGVETRQAFDKEELDEVGPQGYAGDDAAYNKYTTGRATGDLLSKEMQPEKGVTSFVNPQAKAVTQDLTTSLAGANPEMEKRYTMNKLNTATPATDVSGELEEDDLDAMRRIINHRR